ncbi:MAG: sulfatase [Thermoanaerobaculia bacterium]
MTWRRDRYVGFSRTARLVGAMLVLVVVAGCSDRAGDTRDNVVLVMVDTLRADHLGCYGYERETSPNLDKLASSGVLFESFYSVAPWTNPAIASLFTGRYPRAVFPPLPHKKAIGIPLPSQLPTLAERLQEAGYRTVALVDHPGINPELQFDQGFEQWHSLFREGDFDTWTVTDSGFVLDRFEAALDELDGATFFLYLHLVYPHRPYAPPPPYDTMFGPSSSKTGRAHRQAMINAYDGEVRYTDDLIGRIAGALEIRRLTESTWLMVTSDHGEGFWEHNQAEHGNSFFNELTRVPLVLVPPRRERVAGLRVKAPASLVDLKPTILGLAGLEPDKELEGRDLRTSWSNPADFEAPRWLFLASPHSQDVEAAAVVRGDLKYIDRLPWRQARPALFDLAEDPTEKHNLAGVSPQAAEMSRRLQAHLIQTEQLRSGLLKEDEVELDKEVLERLRALGYLQ